MPQLCVLLLTIVAGEHNTVTFLGIATNDIPDPCATRGPYAPAQLASL